MFRYFLMEKYKAEPVKVFSLTEAIKDYNRMLYDFNIKKYQYQKLKFQQGESGDELCEVCRLEHPKLMPNHHRLEMEEQERRKYQEFLEEFKRIKRKVLGKTKKEADPE
jgi:hypothetical protein